MTSITRIAAAIFAILFVCSAHAQTIKSGHVIGNGTSAERSATDASLLSVAQQTGSGLGAGWGATIAAPSPFVIIGGTAAYLNLGSSSIGAGVNVVGFDSDVLAQPTNHTSISATCGVTNATLTPGFTDANCAEININAINGDAIFSSLSFGTTQAKSTMKALDINGTYLASGQRLLTGEIITCYGGSSDCAAKTTFVTFASGPIAGDEGSGFTDVNLLSQQGFLSLSTITGTQPAQSTVNTTTTQIIAASKTAQTITVASSTGCVVGQWVVLAQQLPSAQDSKTAMQITACGTNTIQGIVRANYVSGVTVTPAKVLTFNSTFQTGQNRVMVDLSQPTYATGTVASIAGNIFTGSGTTWAANMVGGNATNIGCIALDADTYTGSPFNGVAPAANGPLHSYYQIINFTDATHLGVNSPNTAGAGNYSGIGVGTTHTYKIYPCAEILYLGNTNGSVTGLVVLETSTSTWAVGDLVETAIVPFPYIVASQYHIQSWTPGGTFEGFEDIENTGSAQGEYGIRINGRQPAGALQTPAWLDALNIDFSVTALLVGTHVTGPAIKMAQGIFDGCASDNCGEIQWSAAYIRPNTANQGMDFNMTEGSNSLLQAIGSGVVAGGATVKSELLWPGIVTTTPTNFSTFPACSSALSGSTAEMLANVNTPFGATISSNGAFLPVKAHCNGTNWTVMAN
jgi:hypothetical protein